MNRHRSNSTFTLIALLLLSVAAVAHAHPMGNFSINHYARVSVRTDAICIRYIIDMAEIPTVSERAAMDTNGDGKISEQERNAYLTTAAIHLANGITLKLNGKPAVPQIKPDSLTFVSGAGGLPTMRITLDLIVPPANFKPGTTESVDYADTNYDARTGWKEIVVAPDAGIRIVGSHVSQTDLSRQLTAYPVDATVAPPQQTEAHFTIQNSQGTGNLAAPISGASINPENSPPTRSGSPAKSAGNTPRDPFTQAIARGQLTTGLVLLSLAIAFSFGALHALSPGHGKAMMAAYLVGARGTARHAVLLGLVVTITHTIGVLALGLVMLFAAQYVVPERLYPFLSALSGLMIAVMGAVLLRQRWSASKSSTDGDDYGSAPNNGAYDNVPLPDPAGIAASGAGVSEQYGKPNKGPLSVRSLVALGITGGILPCPSALVVMLSAVALHRVGFGMILTIVAFSVGLAVVLTSIGVCVVYMRSLTERIPTRSKLFQRLPTVSAAFVTLIGLFLIFKFLRGGY